MEKELEDKKRRNKREEANKTIQKYRKNTKEKIARILKIKK
jgi:hypothetical protein